MTGLVISAASQLREEVLIPAANLMGGSVSGAHLIEVVEEMAGESTPRQDYIASSANQPVLHGRFGWMAGAPLVCSPEYPVAIGIPSGAIGQDRNKIIPLIAGTSRRWPGVLR